MGVFDFFSEFGSVIAFILVIALVGAIVSIVRANIPQKILPDQKNKIVDVDFTSGIIGLFLSSPMTKINNAIKKENENGWKVVNIIDSEKGNLFVSLMQLVLLVVTFGLYTFSIGKYIIFERINDAEKQKEI